MVERLPNSEVINPDKRLEILSENLTRSMADPQFWREMESRFRALPDPTRSLRADWHSIVGNGKEGDWRLTGELSKSLRVRFEALARQAGAAIDNPAGSDSLVSWLELLKGVGSNFDFGFYGIEVREDGTDGPQFLTGTLWHVCESSADYCCVLESEAFEHRGAVGRNAGNLSADSMNDEDVRRADGFAAPARTEPAAPKKRGRKRTFTSSQLENARQMKKNGRPNNEIAKLLYNTPNPTPEQRRSVPTTLKYHFGSKK